MATVVSLAGIVLAGSLLASELLREETIHKFIVYKFILSLARKDYNFTVSSRTSSLASSEPASTMPARLLWQ